MTTSSYPPVHHDREPHRVAKAPLVNPQYVRDPARKARILDAAAQLIAQRGFLGVNLADIDTTACIVGSGDYRHFDSKAAILVELFDRVVDRLNSDAEDALLGCDGGLRKRSIEWMPEMVV